MKTFFSVLFLLCICLSAFGTGNIGDTTKYASWYKCLVVAPNKDTIHGRVKPKYEYFGKGSFVMLLDNGKQRTVKPSQIAQLWILNSHDTIRYIALNAADDYHTYTTLYRIIVDGKCRLLYNEGIRAVQLLSLRPAFSSHSGSDGAGFSYSHIFTIFYKGEIWEIIASPEDFMMDPETDFQSLGRKVFKECTTVAFRLETGQYKLGDIREVIKEFNQCIEGPNTSK